MKPPPFQYHTPATVSETVQLLASLDNATLLAGGQSLMPMLNMRYVLPDHVIDLNRVEGLNDVRTGDGWLEIGGMTRQREVEFSDEIRRLCPLLAEAILLVGHRQTRNRGTIGGSLSHSDPAAEIPVVCAGLDAIIRVQGPEGEREIPFHEFSAGYMSTSMAFDEILLSIRIPLWDLGHGYGFEEVARRHGDFAIVSAAALLATGPDGRITRASLTLGGVGPAPLRIAEAESALVGQSGSADAFAGAATICQTIDAMDDVHAPARYRQQLAAVLARRALDKAWSRVAAASGNNHP